MRRLSGCLLVLPASWQGLPASDQALKRAQGDYTFFASENLYGLTVLGPPSK